MFVCCLLWFYVYHQHDFPTFDVILPKVWGRYLAKTFSPVPMIEEGHTKGLLICFSYECSSIHASLLCLAS